VSLAGSGGKLNKPGYKVREAITQLALHFTLFIQIEDPYVQIRSTKVPPTQLIQLR
jgi:hypothetical protein